MNGDILTDLDYRELYRTHLNGEQLLTIAGYRRYVDISLGVLHYDSTYALTGFQEKPRMWFDVSMGVYVLSPQVRDVFPDSGPYGFDGLVRDLMDRGMPPRVYPFDGIWLDIGRIEDYGVATDTYVEFRDRLIPPQQPVVLTR